MKTGEFLCYFLVAEQESNQRTQHRGGVESIAPAIEATRPYEPHPARIAVRAEQLNPDPVPSENVPIF